jgi:hypothetical protein
VNRQTFWCNCEAATALQHSQRDSNVTGGEFAAALQINPTAAMMNVVACIIVRAYLDGASLP